MLNFLKLKQKYFISSCSSYSLPPPSLLECFISQYLNCNDVFCKVVCMYMFMYIWKWRGQYDLVFLSNSPKASEGQVLILHWILQPQWLLALTVHSLSVTHTHMHRDSANGLHHSLNICLWRKFTAHITCMLDL